MLSNVRYNFHSDVCFKLKIYFELLVTDLSQDSNSLASLSETGVSPLVSSIAANKYASSSSSESSTSTTLNCSVLAISVNHLKCSLLTFSITILILQI